MKTKTNIELMTEALAELSDVLDYIASERGEDDTLYVALSGVETKLETVVSRYAKKVVPQ
jgi:ribosome-associated translation inhibitor RaiA